jgi:hypothetical protein
MLQTESVRDAAWGCEWVGTPVPFVRSLSFIINMANKEIVLTAGKFVPVSKATLMNVRFYRRGVQNTTERLSKFLYPSVRLYTQNDSRNVGRIFMKSEAEECK